MITKIPIMDTNVNKAVWIITALGLLLGLSIGQLHHQHLHIKKLEKRTSRNGLIYISKPQHDASHYHPASDALSKMEELRARLDLERGRLEKERARLHRELERFHRMEHGRIHRDHTRRKGIILQEEW